MCTIDIFDNLQPVDLNLNAPPPFSGLEERRFGDGPYR